MLVPIADLKASLECFHQEVEIYPIWLCPFKLPNNPGMLRTHYQDGEMAKMLADVGVSGVHHNTLKKKHIKKKFIHQNWLGISSCGCTFPWQEFAPPLTTLALMLMDPPMV